MVFPSLFDIQEAADLLTQGRLVAFPTETVYGLGGDAENNQAVAAIYRVKGRPNNHPIIVHVHTTADLNRWAKDIPLAAEQLMEAFWPGPLTLILKRADTLSTEAGAGQSTLGLRSPNHPVAQALLQAFKNGQGGIAAPSANRFGHISPTTAQHVIAEFEQEIQAGELARVLDSGATDVGIESTIVDLSRLDTHGPVLLRPGHISKESLMAVLGVPFHTAQKNDHTTPKASGTLAAHYAPNTPTILVPTKDLDRILAEFNQAKKQIVLLHYHEKNNYPFPHILLPQHATEYAKALYASLRELDALKKEVIVIEAPPSTKEWLAVMDRLKRASYAHTLDMYSEHKK